MTPPNDSAEQPTQSEVFNHWTKLAASEIVNRPTLNEGEGTLEDMQDAYDENEEILKELNRVSEIIKKHAAELTARAEAAEKQLASLKEEIRIARKEWMGRDVGHLPLREAMEQVRKSLDDQLSAEFERNTSLRAQLEQLNKRAWRDDVELPCLQLELETTAKQLEQARKESVENDEEIGACRQEIGVYEISLRQEKERADEAEARLRTAEQENAELRKAATALITTIEAHEVVCLNCDGTDDPYCGCHKAPMKKLKALAAPPADRPNAASPTEGGAR